ncbi:MAG: hypothetical protein ACKOPS_09400, partial [Cyanobium sp.]
LQGSATPWLERTPPAPAVAHELLRQLRAFLGPEGFYWLAACAVFPELHWTITVHLGQRLRGRGQWRGRGWPSAPPQPSRRTSPCRPSRPCSRAAPPPGWSARPPRQRWRKSC